MGGGDEEIGLMIADAIDKVSFDGVITVEESKSLATELDITEGMAFDRGYSSPYFVTDEDRLICEFENPSILITDKKISRTKYKKINQKKLNTKNERNNKKGQEKTAQQQSITNDKT